MRLNRGFTLLEVIIGAMIVGLLSMILAPAVTKYSDQAKEARVKQDMKTLAIAIGDFTLRNGVAPSSLDDLAVYDEDANPNPLAEIPRDPYTGDPYNYVRNVGSTGPVLNLVASTGTSLITVLGDHLIPTTLGGSATPVSLDGEGEEGGEGGGGGTTGSVEGWTWFGTFKIAGVTEDHTHWVVTPTNATPPVPAGHDPGTWRSGSEAGVYVDGVYKGDSDTAGHFSLTGIPIGSHTVSVFGYKSQTWQIQNGSVTVEEGVTAGVTAEEEKPWEPGGYNIILWHQTYTEDGVPKQRLITVNTGDPGLVPPPSGSGVIENVVTTPAVGYHVYFPTGVFRGHTVLTGNPPYQRASLMMGNGSPVGGPYELSFTDPDGNPIPGVGTIEVTETGMPPPVYDSYYQ